jgi:hypothetical protein
MLRVNLDPYLKEKGWTASDLHAPPEGAYIWAVFEKRRVTFKNLVGRSIIYPHRPTSTSTVITGKK